MQRKSQGVKDMELNCEVKGERRMVELKWRVLVKRRQRQNYGFGSLLNVDGKRYKLVVWS